MLVPDQTAADCEAKLKVRLAKCRYGDIEVKVTGGYDPTQTNEHPSLLKASTAVYKQQGMHVSLSPLLAGSWPGHVSRALP
jgi:di/tripeptidase